jgi:hypothetical protein
MVMTFTFVCHLQEQLSALIKSKKEKRRQAEIEKERLELEVIPYLLITVALVWKRERFSG